MSKKHKDDLGDRMKSYEAHECGRQFIPLLPIYARLDGRGFSKFTKGMDRPFDTRMSQAMIDVTRYLVQATGAVCGYTQSDEISLAWEHDDYRKGRFFDGKVQKMVSVLPAMAAAKFNRLIRGWEPYDDRLPAFDCRVIQMPNRVEIANMFLWRALDASKNAVSMAAQHHFSHKSLQGQKRSDMLLRMAAKGINFEAYPSEFRHGSFVRRVLTSRPLTPDEIERAKTKAPTEVIRSDYPRLPLGDFRTVLNRDAVLFDGAKPLYLTDVAQQPFPLG